MSTIPKRYTRFELIDTTGRVVVHYGNTQSLEQDECRTLKVFIDQPARAKDAELIQKLVNALHWYVEEDDVMEGDFSAEGGTNWDEENAPWIEGRNEAISILDAAEAAGFKPN